MFKLIICGNVVRKPEGRDVNGIACSNFTVAVNVWKGGAQQTEYVRCTAWRSIADKCVKYLDKGSKVICWGRPSVHAWNSREDNSACAQMELDCEDVEFAGRPPVEKPVENAEIGMTPVEDDDGVPFC